MNAFFVLGFITTALSVASMFITIRDGREVAFVEAAGGLVGFAAMLYGMTNA